MQNGIIILPIGEESPDAQPVNTAAAVHSLLAQIDRTGDQIGAAASQQVRQISPQRLAVLADQLDQLAQRAAELAADQSDEPARTEADTAAAEFEVLRQILAAEAAELAAAEAEKRAAELAALPKVDQLPQFTEGIPQPVDKVTHNIFVAANDGGQRYGEYRITRSSKDAKSPLIAILGFSATRDSVERLEALTAFDHLILLAIGGLCENGIMHFSIGQLWRAMGNRGELNGRDRNKIRHSLEKLSRTRIYLRQTAFDFSREDDFALIEYRYRAEAYRGKKVQCIYMLAAPAWLEIARAQRQITKIPFEAYADGTPMTEQGMALSIYLLQEIAHMRNQKDYPRQMRLDTLAEAAGANISHHEARRKFCRKIETKLTYYANMKSPYIASWSRYENGYKIKIP